MAMRFFLTTTSILALMPAALLAQFGDGRGEFIFPFGIALDQSGNTYVSETGNDRLQKLDPSQEWLGGWGRFGSDSARFNDPLGLAMAGSDLLLVADSGNRRIMCFGTDGDFKLAIPLPDSSLPWGLAFGDGQIYITDEARCLVEVRDQDGRLLRSFGGPGREAGQLDKPRGIALDQEGRAWVVDSGNNRIQVFGPDGSPVLSFGSYGDNEGEFDGPSGIAISRQGLVYVTDSGNDRFQEFDLSGAFRSQGGSTGPEPGQFMNPLGIAVDGRGNLYIVDSDNHRVQFFGSGE